MNDQYKKKSIAEQISFGGKSSAKDEGSFGSKAANMLKKAFGGSKAGEAVAAPRSTDPKKEKKKSIAEKINFGGRYK